MQLCRNNIMKDHSCDNCGGAFRSSRTLAYHKKTAQHCAPFIDAYFTCMKCGFGCETLVGFRKHASECTGSQKKSYRVPDETQWQVRCAVLEGMIEATLGVKVPSVKFSNGEITTGSMGKLKQIIKDRLEDKNQSEKPISLERLDSELVVDQDDSHVAVELVAEPPAEPEKLPEPVPQPSRKKAVRERKRRKPVSVPDPVPVPEPTTEPVAEPDEGVEESKTEDPQIDLDLNLATVDTEPIQEVVEDSDSDEDSDPAPPVPAAPQVPVEEAKTWVELSKEIDPETELTRYGITGSSEPATPAQYKKSREQTIMQFTWAMRNDHSEQNVKRNLSVICRTLLGNMGNYPTIMMIDTYAVYRDVLKILTSLGYSKATAKKWMLEYMLPYPLVRFTDVMSDYTDNRPTAEDTALSRAMLTHYCSRSFGPGFANNGGALVFQMFRYTEAMESFIFTEQKWWEKGCYYAPQRGERRTNPVTFISNIDGKWVYDYYMVKFAKKMFGELMDGIRNRFREIYTLIHLTNEYVEDWDSNSGVYAEDLYNLLRCYLTIYARFTLKDFIERLRFIVADEALDNNQRLKEDRLREFGLGRVPDKKEARRDWDAVKGRPEYETIFAGFMALFDEPRERMFWDEATGIQGEGGWFYDYSTYVQYIEPRFHRFFRSLYPEAFYEMTEQSEDKSHNAPSDVWISLNISEVPRLKLVEAGR